MIQRTIRVCVRLEKEADKDAVLAAMEQALGRVPELIWRFREQPVLVLRLQPRELALLRRLPGVRSAEPEGQIPLPTKPGPPAAEK